MRAAALPDLPAGRFQIRVAAGYDSRMNPDSTYMRMAIVQAQSAHVAGEIPVGAVVVKNGQVIGVGHNAPIALHDPSAHAEIVAMRAAAQTLGNYRLEGCELFVTLEPCAMCAGAMMHARLARVIYGAQDPKTGAAGSVLDLFANTQINHHTAVEAGVLATECSAVLQAFFKERRQTRAQSAQPLSDDALRTPLSVFDALEAYPFTSSYFNAGDVVNGWRMHYLDEGPDQAITVLCLHDLYGWSYGFRHLIPTLSASGMRVLVPDLIGFGMSDKPKKEAAQTVALHLNSLEKLLDHLQISRFVLVGEGSGFPLARLLASRWPHRVLQVCQVSPVSESVPDLYGVNRLPFPDRGYQAGLRAAPQLIESLTSAVAALPPSQGDAVIALWSGSMDRVAGHLAAAFLRG